MRLLVIEDDPKVATFVQRGLMQEAYAVDVAGDGAEGVMLARESNYDLIILDLVLPKLPGQQVLHKVRDRTPALPILVLTAKDSAEEVVLALDAGADDYLVKPFAFAELTARIRALLRRGKHSVDNVFKLADLVLDRTHRTVTRAGQKIELSTKEFALLEYLFRHARRAVTRTSIIEHVWDIHFDSVTNVVDVYINYLRNKIDKQFSPPLIHTVRGVGYILTDENDPAA